MSNPAWSQDLAIWDYFPGAYRYGGRPASVMRENIIIPVDSGGLFVYENFKKRRMELTFRFSERELPFFQAWDDWTHGTQFPFYFSLTGNVAQYIYMRKEQDFDPVEIDSPGNREPMFDYTTVLIEELV